MTQEAGSYLDFPFSDALPDRACQLEPGEQAAGKMTTLFLAFTASQISSQNVTL